MADNFDDAVTSFGEEGSKKLFRYPIPLFFHLFFRGSALLVYLFSSIFTNSYIITFLVIVFLLSMDFWTVKNVSGRLLVGLRWWNFVDETGQNHWKFESKKENTRSNTMEGRIFWLSLVLTPVLWFIFAFMSLLHMSWLIITLIGISMTGANLWGYLRCKWSSRQEVSAYLSQTMFRSFLNRATQQTTTPTGTSQGNI